MENLAPYAVCEANSRGRLHGEAAPRWRNQFQRDRDRIIHSSAFRRLEYKTQVFVNHEGDMFRTRLTHSLEVAQIARSVARALHINEDLTEAIALAHDLGHTPFGHAGQHALNACLREFGGFEHNLHSLRVVDLLEQRYPAFPGLNLLFETREGILKHCSHQNALQIGALGQRFLSQRQPSLEAQLANVADEIAYNHHDIDDGLRAGLLSLEQLRELTLFRATETDVRARWPQIDAKRLRHTVLREMLNHFVTDLIEQTRARIRDLAPADLAAIHAASEPLVDLSPALRSQHFSLKRLLRIELYEHPQVQHMAQRSQEIVSDLFRRLMDDAACWPDALGEWPRDPTLRARAVADYVAGMTDRYATSEHQRLHPSGVGS
ncbi:MAG: deoxyguanosinetriphosphate triphosphohydrolase [Gammaproteobacteria bacterium]|nr:deoxyguanosinetriphosphate triphosphohydrolase [Gammaproteobacteria bacterium]